MKILLVNPPSNKMLIGNNPAFIDEVRGHNPCLGLGYLAAMIAKFTTNYVRLFDCQINNSVSLEHELRYGGYDVVGITMTTFTLLDAIDTIKKIRTYSPKSIIIAGGTHPTIYPQETLNLGADIVIRGEGEGPFLDILREGPANFRGKISDHAVWEHDLDLIPFPLRVDIEQYSSVFSDGMATTLITSRGCPYNCGFCYRPVVGRTFRARTPANVVREIQECYARGIRNFLIYDDTFTVDARRVSEIAKGIIDAKLRIKFDIRSRVNCVNKGMLEDLKRAGLIQIHFGIESGVQRILDRINKRITLKQIEDAFAMTRKLRIRTLGYIMIGNPDESPEDIDETEKFVRHVQPDYLHATVFTPFPATPLYIDWQRINKKDPWLEYARVPNVLFTPPIWDEVQGREWYQTRLEAIYKAFYLNPQFITKRMWDFKKWGKYFRAGMSLLRRSK